MAANLSGKVIVITGGGSGIGAETAHALAARGAKVSLADLSKPGLETVQSSIKQKYPDAKVLITPLDVCSTEAVDKWIADTVSQFGKLDGAVNLAGVIGPGIGVKGVEDLDDKEWDFIVNINLTGTFRSLRAELKAMKDGGSVVTTASVAGIKGFAFNSAYTASKHGVVGLTKSAAKEVGKRGIRVNCVCPGYTATAMTKKSDELHKEAGLKEEKEKNLNQAIALERAGQPEDIASLICFLLGDESKYITAGSFANDPR